MIKEIIEEGYMPHKSSGKFSVSGVSGCRREKYFALWKQYKKTWTAKDFRVFDLGDYVHRKCVSELICNAASHGFEVVAAEVNLPEHQYLSGRVDCILSKIKNGEKTVVDFKSCSRWTINKVKEGIVSQGYKDQVNLYMHLLGIHKGYLLFVCKDNSEVEEFEVEYDEQRALEVINEITDFFENYVYKGVMPPKCDGGDFGCEMCDDKLEDFDIMDAQLNIQKQLNNGGSYKDLYNG